MNETNNALLTAALSAAVPLWIERVRNYTPEHRAARAQACSEAVAEHGDIIQFKSKRRGDTADAFNRLAEGLAILAFQPGGVKTMGLHFEAT